MKNFRKWLDENELVTYMTMQPSEQICRKNGENFPTGFPAMALEDVFNAGYEQCLNDLKDFQQSTKAQEIGG